jgi:hypothetical protein
MLPALTPTSLSVDIEAILGAARPTGRPSQEQQ